MSSSDQKVNDQDLALLNTLLQDNLHRMLWDIALFMLSRCSTDDTFRFLINTLACKEDPSVDTVNDEESLGRAVMRIPADGYMHVGGLHVFVDDESQLDWQVHEAEWLHLHWASRASQCGVLAQVVNEMRVVGCR
jgi:hypothetical protein